VPPVPLGCLGPWLGFGKITLLTPEPDDDDRARCSRKIRIEKLNEQNRVAGKRMGISNTAKLFLASPHFVLDNATLQV